MKRFLLSFLFFFFVCRIGELDSRFSLSMWRWIPISVCRDSGGGMLARDLVHVLNLGLGSRMSLHQYLRNPSNGQSSGGNCQVGIGDRVLSQVSR